MKSTPIPLEAKGSSAESEINLSLSPSPSFLLRAVAGYVLYVLAFIAGMLIVEASTGGQSCSGAPCGFLLAPVFLGYSGFLVAAVGFFSAKPRMGWGSWISHWFGAMMCGGLVGLAQAAQRALST